VRSVRLVVRLMAVVVIAASLVALVFLATHDDDAERLTAGRPPTQFYEELDPDLLGEYAGVFGSAHNAGDDVGQLVEALRYGADAIEVDVVSVDGRLVAAHDRRLPVVGGLVFRGPSLGEAWSAGQAAGAVLLDLKQSDARFVDAVVQFLTARVGASEALGAEVVVMSPSPQVLERLSDEVPSVLAVLSVSTQVRLADVVADTGLVDQIDGVSVRQTLVTAELGDWVDRNRLLLVAWVVDDLARLNEMVRHGVDVVASDNLAILELLGAEDDDQTRLADRRSEPAGKSGGD
jgi:glycerophosphoryl diester phosphodiesterase